MSDHQFSIDESRLFDLLDSAVAAHATLDGLSESIDELRAEITKLEIGEAGNPQKQKRLDAIRAQFQRARDRRSEVVAALSPKIELGRRCLAHAKSKRVEVGSYAL